MKNIIFILIISIIISFKSNSKLTGEYKANLPDSSYYIFNLSKKKYIHKWGNGNSSQGKFKILDLSSEKKILVCNELIVKKNSKLIKEATNTGDSIIIGGYMGYKKMGNTVFEITLNKDTLLYRKTYTNELQKTQSEGTLIKIKK